VQRTSDGVAALTHDVSVGHRGFYALVFHQFLHRPNAVSCFQKMSGAGVTKNAGCLQCVSTGISMDNNQGSVLTMDNPWRTGSR
jgi:hypothetical protein